MSGEITVHAEKKTYVGVHRYDELDFRTIEFRNGNGWQMCVYAMRDQWAPLAAKLRAAADALEAQEAH